MMNKFSWLGLFCLCAVSLSNQEAKAANFTLVPNNTFEVGDGFFSEPFDGQGDLDAVFPGNFDTVVLGTIGENSENAEFDLRSLLIPSNEVISQVLFQVSVIPNQVSGLGAPGQRPSGLVVRGYTGNGQPDAADFQAGNILASASVSPDYIEEVLTFDVTNFLKTAVANRTDFAGFSVRAQGLGATGLFNTPENGPKLLVTTAANPIDPEGVPEPSSLLGLLALVALGASRSMLKQNA